MGTTITSSTITITPTVATAQLTVLMVHGAVTTAVLASGTEVQLASCFQQATALWYCANVTRTTSDANGSATDGRKVYSSTAPAVADFTATSKLDASTKGFAVTTKYTEVATTTSNSAAAGASGTVNAAVSGTDSANWVFQTAGNTIATDKKTLATKMQYQKTESSASVATTALAQIKTGYATTLLAVQTTISGTTVSGLAVSNITGAASLAAAAAAIAAVMAF